MNEIEERFLDALYRGVTDSEELDRALQLLQDIFGCRGAVLVSVDSQDPTATFNATSGWLKENLQLYLEKYADIDPAPAAIARLPIGSASTTNRMFTEEERRNGRFYNEFFLANGMVETLAGNLYSDQGHLAIVGVMRNAERDAFDDDDIAHMERLMLHITRAVQLRRAFFKVDARSLGLQATVDRLRAGIVLLGDKGAALFVNTAMQAIAQRGDGFMLDRSGRPLPANIEARRRIDALLADVAGGGTGGIVAMQRTSGARDYVVLVAPAPPSSAQSDWERSEPSGGAIVLVHDPEAQPAVMADVLEQGLRLPRGAARLVAALAADDDLKSYAEREGVTIHTARFHLRTALARTGARTQAELVRLAVRLLRDFALAEPKA
ncbi:helix-turn-helix transcriptional regulator [Rhodoplanes sp. Z2-YC6860]|uniref:helix-turn-helix transcriptional regulator n=1 Tax=Rhodoplanes sp. Z2-YC6860 TaxID=674703 RepID=UPI00082E1A19|nr:helix-turn-helix transcriptional regulator [Rhodoplanes sp. Z2-YC6860]